MGNNNQTPNQKRQDTQQSFNNKNISTGRNKSKNKEEEQASLNKNKNLNNVNNINNNLSLLGNNFSNNINMSFTDPKAEDDRYLGIKNQLRFMYKNNFISATFDDICAHLIQSSWKKFKIKQIKNESRGMIEVIYTSLQGVSSSSNSSKMEKIERLLTMTKTPFRIYNLLDYPNLKEIVDEYASIDNLPLVFINNYFIGGCTELQGFIDGDILEGIVNKEYLNSCIVCHTTRYEEEYDKCFYCFNSYTFFAKSKVMKDIWGNRVSQSFSEN